MKKICHVTTVHTYNDNRIFYKECQSLKARGYDVHLIAPVRDDFIEDGIKVVGIGSYSTRLERFFRGLVKSFSKLIKIRPDIVHIHDPELTVLIPLLRMLKFNVIYDIHEDNKAFVLEKKYVPASLRKPLSLTVGYWEKFISKICHTIIAEKYYELRFPKATKILNYPLTVQKNEHIEPNLELNSRYQWYVFTGNVSVERGALENLKILLDLDDSAICYIGRCPKDVYDQVEAFLRNHDIARERFTSIGLEEFIPQSYIQACLNKYPWKAGLALIPESNFNNKKELTKFFDYAAAGLPIICSNFPEWARFVHDGGLGVVYSEKWIEDLDSYMSIASDPVKFNWSTEEDKLLHLYESILLKACS